MNILVAMDRNRVIGQSGGGMPWGRSLKSDLKRFQDLTTKGTVIMGRKTFTDDIAKHFPTGLPGRRNIIITKNREMSVPGCDVVHSLEQAQSMLLPGENAFVIGGAQIYELALSTAKAIYVTEIDHSFEGDIFFPEIDMAQWRLFSEESHRPDERNPYPFTFKVYARNT
jgi:dihydrofolate reductase